MTGTPERKDVVEFLNPKIKTIMETCKVDEATATKYSVEATTLAQELMEKWCRNTRKMHRNRADDIYRLLKKLTAENPTLVNNPLVVEIQKKVLELFAEDFGI